MPEIRNPPSPNKLLPPSQEAQIPTPGDVIFIQLLGKVKIPEGTKLIKGPKIYTPCGRQKSWAFWAQLPLPPAEEESEAQWNGTIERCEMLPNFDSPELPGNTSCLIVLTPANKKTQTPNNQSQH